MARYLGMDYEMSTYAYFKIAMAKRTNKDDIEEECFDAVKNLYDNETDVKVIDIQLMEYKQEKHFTVADVGLELRINVRASDYDEACEQADACAESVDCPVGVAFSACETFDGEVTGEAIDWDWASGE